MVVENRILSKAGLWIAVPSLEGWTNQQTLVVNQWLRNDERSRAFLQEGVHKYNNPYWKADWLEMSLSRKMYAQISTPNLWSDLLLTSYSQINWEEIVKRNR